MSGLLSAAQLGLAWSAYLLMTASPGPSNLSIMGIAMTTGRRDALVFACGVVSGSAVWGLMAALGLSTLLMRYAQAMDMLKIVGGLYLLWLGIRSARSAWRPTALGSDQPAAAKAGRPTWKSLYLGGLGLHLTNPKAILSWLSVVAVGLPPDAPPASALLVVGSCLLLGMGVFGGYAVAFSLPSARRCYLAARRPIEGLLALMFGFAGLRLMLSRS